VRLYGTATVLHPRDPSWAEWLALFPAWPGARQILVVDLDLVTTSCGMAVPLLSYEADRDALLRSAEKKGPSVVEQYWQERNQLSLDGRPTGIRSD
jgi:hypothetical protein